MPEDRISTRGYVGIGLVNPKMAVNVGSVLRAAYAFGVHFVFTSGRRYHKSSTDVCAGYRHVPLFHMERLNKDIIPFDCVPVAVELRPDARSMANYIHPERAIYVFGPEDGTVGLGCCYINFRDVIYIPTRCCLNLAMCVNVVLYDRWSKYERQRLEEERRLP